MNEVEREFAEVNREIAALKAEQKVFACTGIDETGYGDLCVCDDPETKPWQRCPEHDGTVD